MTTTTRPIDELVRRLAAMMPDSVRHVQQDVEKNLRAGLTGALQRMDLVTREEYDVQTKLLARCGERLSELEARVVALEQAAWAARPKARQKKEPGAE